MMIMIIIMYTPTFVAMWNLICDTFDSGQSPCLSVY